MSACAVVRGLHRNLFVVPSSDALANDEELKTLEREREADPSQPKGPLMKRLHVKLLFARASTSCIDSPELAAVVSRIWR